MNRRLVAALAVGVAFGLVAVSGVVATGPASGPAPAADAPSPAGTATDTPTGDDGRTADTSTAVEGRSAAASSATDDGTTIDTGNGTLILRAAPNQSFGGETDLVPGTRLSIRLRSTHNASPFLRSADATVSADGTWTATVDLASVSDQPPFVATVSHDGEELANATGRVVGQPTDPLDGFDHNATRNGTLVRPDDDTPPIANASFDPANGSLHVVNATGQRLTGETDLAPGTPVTVRLVSTGSSPFLRVAETAVTENGTVGATFDLAAVPAGTPFEAVAVYRGERIGNRSGVVEACPGNCSAPADPWLADTIVLARQGETASLPITFENDTDAVTVVVENENESYRLEALVEDTSGDGRVVTTFHTAVTGTEDPTLTAADGDEVTVKLEAALAPPLDPSTYDVDVYRGDDLDGEPVDIGTLVVTPPVDESADSPDAAE